MIRKKDALEYHSKGRRGKIEVIATKPLLTQRDLSLAYTPGVAEPCLEIARDPELVYEYTARANLVAVVSNGTAVLGLGNIGAEASKPVMEGKGCLFKKFADIDVFDIEIRPTDPDEVIAAVAALEPTFGGINLEDIKAPECFYIEEQLKKRMQIPVFHDDQHGTAIISGAALLNAAELQKKDLATLKVVVNGAGASAIACANFYVSLGVALENVTLVDSIGVIYRGRSDGMNPYKERFARATTLRTLSDALRGADLFLGCSKAGTMTKEMVASMADRPIVFALANPDPEIGYQEARSVRSDLIMATGRSDFPNQVNNVLGFPFIFRGALDVRAREINEAMKVAASRALASLARQEVPESVSEAYGNVSFRFGPDYIIPKPFDQRVLWWVAPAVAKAAMDSGVARIQVDLEQYREALQRRLGGTHAVLRRMTHKAKQSPRRIVFPEGDQPKVLRACQQIVDEGIARPILLGSRAYIAKQAAALEHQELLDHVEIIDPRESPELGRYVAEYVRLRQRKGVTPEIARKVMARRNPYGMMMVQLGDAEGLVSGLTMSYSETVRPALEIVGRAPGVEHVTGMYMMVLKGGDVVFFADATVNIEPDAETLAEIAIQVADAVQEFDIHPRVAMISFSNFGSSLHHQSAKVARAVELVHKRRPDIEIDGELQADTAVQFDQLKDLFPFSHLTDAANVLIFPDLGSGNVAYKLMSTLGGATAVGPILLGMGRPITVLPRNAAVSSIVQMTAYTVCRAQGGGGPRGADS
ncbi:MAG: NADP-dependent malic enzyme [Myxococcales bacterium]|nr:NADP-dependent malic enzyme [Myxococcales bacterium]